MQERTRGCQRVYDQPEAAGEVIARTACRTSPAPGDDAEAVMFDLKQPLAAGRQLIGLVGRHGAMNPAGMVRCNIMPIAKGYDRVSQLFF